MKSLKRGATASGLTTEMGEEERARQLARSATISAPAILETARQEAFVRRFVPDLIAQRLMGAGEINHQEISCYDHCVVGFFDVSGFSNLARELEETEKRNLEKAKGRKRNASNLISVTGRGAEDLVNQLNETLTQLIALIRTSGGDIIKFAGDAILVVWISQSAGKPLAEQVSIATDCALRCCALRSDSGLGLHVGIGAGQLVGAHVGGKFGRWEFFIAGEACTQSAKAESYSKLDQVVVSPEALALLETQRAELPVFSTEQIEGSNGYHLVKTMFVNNDMLARNARAVQAQRAQDSYLSEACAKMAEAFVPGPVKEALKSSTIVPGGPRKLTVIFFLLDVTAPKHFRDDDASKQDFLEECQARAFSVQDSAYHYWATLRQFILDDKGFVAIVCLGLPPFFHEDNAVRACKVARRLLKYHKVKAAAGICTGTVFCGIVGSSQRAEYSVAGSCINLAARLMCKAKPGEIWVDAQTKMEAQSQLQFDKLPSLPFKGFDQPVDIYSPVFPDEDAAMMEETEAAAAAAVPAPAVPAPVPVPVLSQTRLGKKDTLVGMERACTDISRLLFVEGEDLVSAPRFGFLEGEAGSGKTRVVEWALSHSKAKRNICTSADASEMNTPFFVWRAVLQSALSLVVSPSSASSSNASRALPPLLPAVASVAATAGKRKFFPNTFRVSGSSLDLKKKVQEKRRSSTESVSSLRRGSSETLAMALDATELFATPPPLPPNPAPLPMEEGEEGTTQQQLSDIAEDVIVEEEEQQQPVAEASATQQLPYIFRRLLHERRARSQKLSSLRHVLPDLVTPSAGASSSSLLLAAEESEVEDINSNHACMDVMLLVLEELGNVETTFIVMENAHFMDKQSWELLRRIHASPSNNSRVRFLLTYRPFDYTHDHVLHQLLHPNTLTMPSPMHRVGSSARMNSGPTPSSPKRNSGLLPSPAASARMTAAGGSGSAPQPLLSKTFHRFGDSKPFRNRHGSISSVASGSSVSHMQPPSASMGMGVAALQHVSTSAFPLEEVIHVQLPALTLRETSQFLSNHFHVSTGPKLLAFLRKTSKGNPRALLECYHALQDQGLISVDNESGIAEENTSLEEIGDLVFAIPQHVRAVLQQQFDKLTMQEQLLLKLASVIGGGSVSLSLLKQLCDKLEVCRDVPVDATLDSLKRGNLLRPMSKGASEGEETMWEFEKDNLRFIVYSQMLHTFRCQVHSAILDVFQERALEWRLREDPTVLGNHAVGAERLALAFQCFREAMRRAVLQDEAVDKGRLLRQSCMDVLDEQEGEQKQEKELTLAHRIVVEVLFAQIAIGKEAWEEAKASLARALDRVEQFNALAGTNIPTLLSPEEAAWGGEGAGLNATCFCAPALFSWWRTGSKQPRNGLARLASRDARGEDVLRDPLALREEDASALVVSNAALSQALLERIREFERDMLARANAIKTFSEAELARCG